MGYQISYECPQCGAPATLEQTDRLFSCAFCRVKSYLTARGVFRYRFVPKNPDKEGLVYFPFWHYKGMLFASVPAGVKHRFVDVSHQAISSRYFPVSVGIRSQALKLKFVTPEDNGRFLKPVQPMSEVLKSISRRYDPAFPKPIIYKTFIGESASLIYSPFYLSGRLYDGILDRPVPAVMADDDFSLDAFSGDRPDWGIQFIPTLCPACGWDLEGHRDSSVLCCRNCETSWKPADGRLKPISAAHIPEAGADVVYLPFWRIRAETNGIALNTYADLVRAANLPKVVQPDMENQPFTFWAMAFKVRPQTFLALSTGMTHAQLQRELVKNMPRGRMVSVNLDVTEALQSLKLMLTAFLRPRESIPELLPRISIRPKKAQLVYVPFREKTHELVQDKLRLALNKNQLRLAGNL